MAPALAAAAATRSAAQRRLPHTRTIIAAGLLSTRTLSTVLLSTTTSENIPAWREHASIVVGFLSIACWVTVYSPQLLENYRNKSSEGLSTLFILIWLAGDALNWLGALLQGLLWTQSQIILWSTATTFVAAVGVIAFFVFKPASSPGGSPPPHVHPPSPDGPGAGIPKHQWRWDAQIYGWASALLYLTSRIPQIMKNRKTYCEGLSMALFVFALLGNSTYVASIMLKSTDPEYLLENASWLVGSLGVVFLDFIVLAQFVKYAPEREKLRLEVEAAAEAEAAAVQALAQPHASA
ncbi:unnamed protein product [Tilletia controversa]|nr:unnamed protein product [Tilletia controversa]